MVFNNIEQQSPEEIVKIIEKNTLENYSVYEINEAFKIVLKKFEEKGKIAESKKVAKEIKLFGWNYSFDKKEFNTSTTYEEEDIAYYKQRVQENCNNYLKAKYCDLIWEHEKDLESAKIGIKAHIKTAKIFIKLSNYHEMAIHLSKAFNLSKSIRNDKQQEQCLKVHMEFIEELKTIDNRYPLYDTINSILENGYYIKEQINLTLLLSIIKQNINSSKQPQDYDNKRLFLDLEEKYYDFIGDKSKIENVLVLKAQSYEAQADFYNKESTNNILSAHYYRTAIEKFQKIGKFQDKIKELKVKLRKCLEEGKKKEMIPISLADSDIKDLDKEVDKFVEMFQNKEIDEILEILASAKFLPTFEDILSNLKNPKHHTSISDFIPAIQINEGLTTGQYSGDDLAEYNAIQEYSLNYQFFIFSHLLKLFHFIKEKFPNYIRNILSRFEQGKIVDKERINYIKFGLIKL